MDYREYKSRNLGQGYYGNGGYSQNYRPYRPYYGGYGGYPQYDNYATRYSRPYTRYDDSSRYAAPPQSQIRREVIPVQQRYTEMVPEQRIEYRPVEKEYTDYIEIQHQTDYVPVPRMEKYTEYIPVEKFKESIDYVPVENSSVIRAPQQYQYDRRYQLFIQYYTPRRAPEYLNQMTRRGQSGYYPYSSYVDRPQYYGDRTAYTSAHSLKKL